MNANAAAGLLIWLVGLALYWLPTLVALGRRARGRRGMNLGPITVINLFLGWTVIGWVVALAMAVRDRDRRRVG